MRSSSWKLCNQLLVNFTRRLSNENVKTCCRANCATECRHGDKMQLTDAIPATSFSRPQVTTREDRQTELTNCLERFADKWMPDAKTNRKSNFDQIYFCHFELWIRFMAVICCSAYIHFWIWLHFPPLSFFFLIFHGIWITAARSVWKFF